MTLETLRRLCLGLPGATEQIQWGADLVFKVGGKMFCVACTEVAPNVMSFKCDDETFAELCEREGIIPAPYMARAKWVALETWSTLGDRELEPLVETAYRLIREKLPRKTQLSLGGTPAASAAPKAKARARKAPARTPQPAARTRAAAGGTRKTTTAKVATRKKITLKTATRKKR